MSLPASRSRRELAADILKYFVANPSAVDSLEGILRWRIPELLVRRTAVDAAAVLEWLVANEYLVEHVTSSSGSNYCLNRQRRAETEQMLARLGDPADETK